MSDERTLSDAVAGAVAAAGTTLAFGVPGGGANLDTIGALEAAGLRFVLAHGETASAIMAATAAELTGTPGVCLATRGPGAASLANGIAHARLDRCPMIAITDVVPAAQRARVAHQLVDQRQLLGASAKASCTLGREPGALASKAVRVAAGPPWGPVHVDLDPSAESDGGELEARARTGPSDADLERAREVLGPALRPVLLAGVGCRGREQAVARFAERHGIPVLTTYKAKGCLDERSPLAAGILTGATVEAPILAAADAFLAVGLNPVELIPAPWPYPAPVVAVGPWVSADAYFPVEVALDGPLDELLESLDGAASGTAWGDVPRKHRAAVRRRLREITGAPGRIGPVDVLLAARAAFGPEAIATVDAGAHMLAAMELWTVPGPQQALISSGLATMGFALPAAIAAALVRPERPVVCFTGEGGLGMCLAELETVARLALDVTVVVLDDARLSLIELKQRDSGQGGEGAIRYAEVDFAALGRAMGIPGERITEPRALPGALEAAAARRGPVLLDVVIDPSGYRAVLDTIRAGQRLPAPSSAET